VVAAASAVLLGVLQGFTPGKYRRAAKVPYPNHYASAESIATAETPELKQSKYLFNCAQRAHANYLENLPFALVGLLVGGVRYPLTATGLGVGWLVSRVLYWRGYIREDKTNGAGRYAGGAFWGFQLGFLALLGKTAFDIITA
jgi:glutathione S-transferase